MDSGCRILVADDTAAIHQIFREAAARARMPVTLLEATDGHQCMEILNRNDVQLAFIDNYMPGMSGIEIVWNVRRAGLKTFMTLMSGRPDEELFDELRSAQEQGMVSRAALATIIRTRLGGESLVDVAADMNMSADAIWRRRTRAERCLRVLPLAS